MRPRRSDLRRPLSPASLLTLAEAVRELGGREAEARAWLRACGLVRQPKRGELGERVLWGDVLAVWEEPADEEAPVAAPTGLPRRVLRGQRR